MAVGASVIAYAASLIVQWAVLRTRLGTRISVEPMIQLGPWLGVSNGAGECLVDDVCRPQARNLSFPSRGALNVPRHSGRRRGCAWNIFQLQCLNR